MNESLEQSDYGILIGGEDILKKCFDISDFGTDQTESTNTVQKKLSETLKEMRVRFGTILKTDNVSFLIGAGASLDAGGISLANIPKSLEKALIEKAKDDSKDNVAPNWITLFYETISFLTEKTISYEKRNYLFNSNDTDIIPPISLNLETYLSQLHTWSACMIDTTESLRLDKPIDLFISRNDLKRLIREILQSLALLLNLPIPGKVEKIRCHRIFIKKILTRPLNLRRVNIFTLNYDTLLEQAGDAEGAVLVDGFVGSLRRVFRPESYDIDYYFPAQTTEGRVHRFDRAIHLYKLHGSISWNRCEPNWENPFGFYASFYNQTCHEDDVLIYPSPLKYGQVLGMPYSELFRRFGNAIAQPQSVLFIIGYGFGDEHVNALIRQALAIPSFTLVVVDPNPQSKFVEKLKEFNDKRVWIVTGKKLGTFDGFVQNLLPDLREEEIETQVMATFKRLSSSNTRTEDIGMDDK